MLKGYIERERTRFSESISHSVWQVAVIANNILGNLLFKHWLKLKARLVFLLQISYRCNIYELLKSCQVKNAFEKFRFCFQIITYDVYY